MKKLITVSAAAIMALAFDTDTDYDDLIARSQAALDKTRALTDPLVAVKAQLDSNHALIADLNTRLAAANSNSPTPNPKVAQISQNLTDLLAALDTQAQAEAALQNTPADPAVTPPAPPDGTGSGDASVPGTPQPPDPTV